MKIKVSDVWAEVEKVAGENPHFIYDASETCKYVKDSKPSCLVGHALFRLGIPIGHLEMYDNANDFAGSGIGTVLFEDLYEMDDPVAANKCTLAQDEQDDGVSWGAAVYRAKRAAELVPEKEN